MLIHFFSWDYSLYTNNQNFLNFFKIFLFKSHVLQLDKADHDTTKKEEKLTAQDHDGEEANRDESYI